VNLPNRLTVSRIVFAVLLFAMLEMIRRALNGSTVLEPWKLTLGYFGLGVFVVAVFTDFLDGFLARRRKIVSDFGRIADPFADKVLISGCLVFLCATDEIGDIIQPWVVVVILSREFLVTSLRGFIEARGASFAASASGKLKMVLQSVGIPVILAIVWLDPAIEGRAWSGQVRDTLVYTIVVVTLLSGLPYIRAAMPMIRHKR